MYYVLEIEQKDSGTINVANDGKPFEHFETAQMYCNELLSELPKDYFDYYTLQITCRESLEWSHSQLSEKFISFLHSNDAYGAYMCNYFASKPIKDGQELHAFYWKASEEGFDYWRNLQHKWVKENENNTTN